MGEPEPWLRLGNPRETYDIYFNRLVSELAEDFTREETQKLGFIFQKQLPASFREKHGQNALKLLEHLMQKNGLFSSDKPQKLAHLMDLLAFGEKREKVETFIDKFKDMVLAVQQRVLPPTPMTEPIQEEAEGGYVTFHQNLSTISPSTSIQPSTNSTTAGPIQCDSSSVHSEEPRPRGDYVVFQQSPPHRNTRKKSLSASISKFSEQSSSTDDDDAIYAEPYTDVLLPFMSHEVFPLLLERMKLLINPLRDIVTNNKHQLLTSPPFQCHLPKCTFLIEINPLDGQCLSAKLYLKPGSEMESGSLSNNYYLVGLQVNQGRKKCKKASQNIYSHSSLMKKPTKDFHTGRENGTHSEIQATSGTDKTIEFSTQRRDKGICVAAFPSIITHEVLMDEELIIRPYLMLSFTLKLYQ